MNSAFIVAFMLLRKRQAKISEKSNFQAYNFDIGAEYLMNKFFKVIRNILLLAILAFGVYSYNHNPNVRLATQEALSTLNNRIGQLLNTGTATEPKPQEKKNNNRPKRPKTDRNGKHHGITWRQPQASVYVNIHNNLELRSAAIDAMRVWNRTGVFTFHQINDKKKAQIIIYVANNSQTGAAGETGTTYNPATRTFLKAKVYLNRYYLQSPYYNYSYNRIMNTAEHELGHAIGLNHTNSVSVMYPTGSIYSIQPRDIKKVEQLYGEK